MPGTDAFLWYNVGEWGRYGLAIPNFSNDTRSQNDTIRYLTDVMGRNLQAILWHPDARLRTPPSINTLARIHRLCTRARSILASRAVPAANDHHTGSDYDDPDTQPQHVHNHLNQHIHQHIHIEHNHDATSDYHHSPGFDGS